VIAAQVEACSTAFVTSPVGATRAAIGAGTGTDTAGNRLQEMEPGAVDYLEPGEEVTFNAPQKAGGMYSDFQEWAHRRIATGLNFPYELLVKNWSGLSFATGRLSLADGRVDFTCRQALDRDLWLKPIFHRFLDELVLFGKVDIDPRDYEAHRAHFRRHAWTPPAWAYVINPKQEIDAAVAAIAANLRTKRDYVESTGFALDDVFDERAAEIAREAALKITPAPAAGAAPPPAAAAEPDAEPGAEPDDPDDPEADALADELEPTTDEA
jgi:capsid protein